MDKIFVSVVSYRDPELSKTVADALRQAEKPDRVIFGICRQHGADDPADHTLRGENIRLLEVAPEFSRGRNCVLCIFIHRT